MKKTYIAIVLDRSGSMKYQKDATILGYNEKMSVIRKDAEEPGMDTYVSLYTFNHVVETKYKCLSVNFLEDLRTEEYECIGDTAMLDCVGQAINDLKKETDSDNPDNSYFVNTISDGQERCSKKFTRVSLATLIKECQDTNRWSFAYLGANQDLSQLSHVLGIAPGNFANYDSANGGSSMRAWKESSEKLDVYLKARRRGVTSVQNFHSADGNIADYSTVDPKSNTKAIWRKS